MKLAFLFLVILSSQFCMSQNVFKESLFVYFEFNKSSVSDSVLNNLTDQFHKWDKEGRNILSISISGHADSTGSNAYNDSLSLQRARSIQKILPSHLLDSAVKISIAAFGESNASIQPDSLSRKTVLILAYTLNDRRKSEKNIRLVEDTIIQLSNIQFVEDQPYLTPQSSAAMPSYVRMLKQAKFDALL